MQTFEVTLQKGRTDTLRLQADSVLDVRTIYEALSEARINTIKKVVYTNPNPSDANTNYYRELKILISNGDINRFVNIRFLKRVIDKSKLLNLIKTYLTIDGRKVDKVHALTVWQ